MIIEPPSAYQQNFVGSQSPVPSNIRLLRHRDQFQNRLNISELTKGSKTLP